MLELAIGRCPKTLALQVEFANLLGTSLPIRRLGLRTWCSLSLAFGLSFRHVLAFALREGAAAVGLLVAILAAVAALAFELGSFALLLTFTAPLSGGSNGQGAAARQMLGHLGAGPFKTASLKEFSNNPHECLVVAVSAADFEALIITNVVLQRVGFPKLSQNQSMLHVVVGLGAGLDSRQN